MRTIRRELSPESMASLEIGMAAALRDSEERYAANLVLGIPPENDDMQFLASAIGGDRALLEVLRVTVRVVLWIEVPGDGTPD